MKADVRNSSRPVVFLSREDSLIGNSVKFLAKRFGVEWRTAPEYPLSSAASVVLVAPTNDPKVLEELSSKCGVWNAKTMMHLMRLLYSGESIVRTGEPMVRFSGERLERLLAIRRGEWAFDDIMAEATAVQASIEAGRGRLPPECDRQKVDKLIEAVMEEACVA